MGFMNPSELVAKWRRADLRERQAAQEHFLDLCRMLGHPTPAEMDPSGERFCFERGASKHSGGDGWADVWKKGFFGWEYKGKHKDLAAAYTQLLDYREALQNPPLLIVSDIERIEVHTNFTNTAPAVHTIHLESLSTLESIRLLRAVFFDPELLRPTVLKVHITEQAARKVGALAGALRDRGKEPTRVARFLDRLVFCMFAEDVGLLPRDIFTSALRASRHVPERLSQLLGQLFRAMAEGGFYGNDEIRRFDGHLFSDAEVLDLRADEIALLEAVAALEWGDVEPAVFGTLFERGLDPDARAQIGAHYTSREDIETLVEPVVMNPLRQDWEITRSLVLNVLSTGKKHPSGNEKPPVGPRLTKAREEARILIRSFLDRLGAVKVLDPACGSGNFLYVTMQKLLDLEREAASFADVHGIGGHLPRVQPAQLWGIEINPYAFELAQMTVWIGYLQWMAQHGFPWPSDPVLKPFVTFRCMDAILERSETSHVSEPEWPATDFIIGNPPFLGGKLLRRNLGDQYVDQLHGLWRDRVPPEADLCCYWFEKARRHIEERRCERAGLLATQGIRGGANRKVLQRIKHTGDIFFAVSDQEWVLDGANVHVSLIGFDDGRETERVLDGLTVATINANLTANADLTRAARLPANAGLAFMGDTKGGSFELTDDEARALLAEPNPHGRPNSDVVVPWVNGLDVTRRHRSMWIVDFGAAMAEADAARYQEPFALVEARVKPTRCTNTRETYRQFWWRHVEARPGMRAALAGLPRFLVTARVTKHRLFAWLSAPTLPDSQVFAFALADDAHFGILHSRIHEVWARAQGTQVRERESGFRYTPTTCFETFPFPWPLNPGPPKPGPLSATSHPPRSNGTPIDTDPVEAVGAAARDLDALRTAWLNPPEWTVEEVLTFSGSVHGPWSRYVHDPDHRGVGAVRYPRLVPRAPDCAARLQARTLTNLYNQRPAWLQQAHQRLDAAVFAAYGWDPTMSDEQLLESLLAINTARAMGEASPEGEPD